MISAASSLHTLPRGPRTSPTGTPRWARPYLNRDRFPPFCSSLATVDACFCSARAFSPIAGLGSFVQLDKELWSYLGIAGYSSVTAYKDAGGNQQVIAQHNREALRDSPYSMALSRSGMLFLIPTMLGYFSAKYFTAGGSRSLPVQPGMLYR